MSSMSVEPIFNIEGLTVRLVSTGQVILDRIDLAVGPRDRLAVIGASGSGKSMLIKAATGFLDRSVFACHGIVSCAGRRIDLQELSQAAHQRMMTSSVCVIWQNSIGSLNPTHKIGTQLVQTLRLHHVASRADLRAQAYEWIERVGIDDPKRIARLYPHQLSGGMNQRISLALGLCGGQPIVVADEPTTALDTVRQRECLDLIRSICDHDGRTLIFASHDLAVCSQLCSRVIVIDDGHIIEQGSLEDVFAHPHHEVTREILAHVRRLVL